MSYTGITTSLNSYMRGSSRMSGFSGVRYDDYQPFIKSASDIVSQIESGDAVDYASLMGDVELSTDDFKEVISDFISSMQRHSSRSSDSFAIHLTDDAFENMMTDKSYMNWVLNTIQDSFNTEDPRAEALGGAFDVKYFGSAIKNYAADFWYSGTDPFTSMYNWDTFNQKSSGSFWSDINSNAQQAQLLARAHAKQQQMMAQQAASQMQAAQAVKNEK